LVGLPGHCIDHGLAQTALLQKGLRVRIVATQSLIPCAVEILFERRHGVAPGQAGGEQGAHTSDGVAELASELEVLAEF